MGIKQTLEAEVQAILSPQWSVEETSEVPTPESLRLNSNHAKFLKSATVLYADLDGSTNMVDNYKWWFSAEVYKCYLRSASQLIKAENGIITAYDGDRVMAIFTGGSKNTNAVKAALKINWAVEEIIRPAIKRRYPDTEFLLKHVIGIDTSGLRAARVGVRGDNDIVWVGRAANYAAKLCSLSDKPLWITKDVFENMNDEVKYTNASVLMWEARLWTKMNNFSIYCSHFQVGFGLTLGPRVNPKFARQDR